AVTRLLDRLAERGGGDLVKELPMPLPMGVIFTLLGVPPSDRQKPREWMDLPPERGPATPPAPPRAPVPLAPPTQPSGQCVEELRRRPHEGRVAALLDAEVEGDDGTPTRLTDGEIVGFCSLLGAAGNETVTKLLANACVLFARHPEEYAKIRADQGLIPDA